MTTAASRPEIVSLLETRARTDSKIPTRWMWASLASYVTWTTVAVITYVYARQLETPITLLPAILSISLGQLVSIIAIAGFVSSGLFSYLVYKLVSRRNQHFARAENLLWATIDAARPTVQREDMKFQLALGSAERDLMKLTETTKEHSAILWSLLSFIPYAGWISMVYVLSFLSHDIRKHELQEELVLEDLGEAMKTHGRELPVRQKRRPNRPVILYVTLSILAPGILLSLWLYLAVEVFAVEVLAGSQAPDLFAQSIIFLVLGLAVLSIVQLSWVFQAVKDPQSHFVYHHSVESTLWPDVIQGRSLGGSA